MCSSLTASRARASSGAELEQLKAVERVEAAASVNGSVSAIAPTITGDGSRFTPARLHYPLHAMGALDNLPPDQRAVLQMVLQRGHSYDEIAELLSIDRAAVRQRALDALRRTHAGDRPAGPERALVTDYLLGQLPDRVAEQVTAYLRPLTPTANGPGPSPPRSARSRPGTA